MDYTLKNCTISFFLLSHLYNPECTKCMELVIIPCSEETVYKIYITIWLPSALSAILKVIFQKHQGSTENVLWHNIRSGVCSLSLDLAICVLKQTIKKINQTNTRKNIWIVTLSKFPLRNWSIFHGIIEKFKLEITL